MQKILKLFLALLLLFMALISLGAQAQIVLPADKITAIEAAIQAEMNQSKIPGLSVAIVMADQLRYAKGFGLADVENSVPAKATTVYRLGSLSKPLTAIGVMQLAEKGKLELDSPIQKYCPAFPVKPWPVSARQLLGHLGGIRDYNNQKFLEEYLSTRRYNSVTESLSIFKDDPLIHEPGTKYAYSTYGYNLLGCAIEGASTLTYENYLRDHILKPAGMEQTGVDEVSRIISQRARGYSRTQEGSWNNTALVDTSNKIPAGGLVSTVEDLSKFAIALRKGTLVSKASLEQMWTRQKTREGKETSYGLGWNLSERNGLKEVYHGGSAAGFSTFLYMIPEKGLAVVFLTNLELLGRRDVLARQIADIALR